MADFATLRTDIPTWMNNDSDELAAAVPGLIRAAEARLFRDLENRALYKRVTGTLAPGQDLLAIPADLVKIRYLSVYHGGEWQPLRLKTLGFLDEFAPDPALRGVPRYYAVEDASNWRLALPPLAGTPYRLRYKARLPRLSVTNPTNWLTENVYDALVSAACVDACLFVHDDASPTLSERHMQRYAQIVGATNEDAEGEKSDEFAPIKEAAR